MFKIIIKIYFKGSYPIRRVFEHGGSVFQPSSYICQIEKVLLPKVFLLIKNYPEISKIIFDEFKLQIC